MEIILQRLGTVEAAAVIGQDELGLAIPAGSAFSGLLQQPAAALAVIGSLRKGRREREKHGLPVVIAPQPPEALAVVRRVAAEREAPLIEVGRDWHWRARGQAPDGQRLDVYPTEGIRGASYADLRLPLLGIHQLENAATAVATLEVLRERGLTISDEALRAGLADVRWPGRFEILGRRPWVVVDGAHNIYSLERLLESIGAFLPHRRLILVVGIGVTHSPRELLGVLLPAATRVLTTRSRHVRATPPEELAALAREAGHDATVTGSVGEAVRAAVAEAHPDDLVLVTGSLFVVAEAREAWAEMQGLPPLPSDPPGAY